MKLYQKVLAVALPLTALSAAGIAYYCREAVGRALLEDLEARSVEKAEEVMPTLLPGFKSGLEKDLLPRLQACAAMGAIYAAAIGTDGRVLADTDVLEKGRRLDDPFTKRALASSTHQSRLFTRDGQAVLELDVAAWAPVSPDAEAMLFEGLRPRGRRVGLLRLGLSLNEMQATQGRVAWAVTVVVAVGVTLALILISLILRGLLHPVRELADAVVRIGRGDYGTRVAVATSDEVGELARRFNQMSEDLARTTVSKDHLAQILESTLDALFVTDEHGAISLVNPAAMRMTGRTEAELVGRQVRELFDGEAPVLGVCSDVELSLIAAEGARLPVLFSSSLMKEPGKPAKGFVCGAKDISDRKRAEAAEAAKERERLQRDFIANVSHDLRTPLTAIKGFAETILRDEAAEPSVAREFVRTILLNANRLAVLVDELLALALLETGRRRLRLEELELGGFVRELAQSMQPLARKRGLSIDVAVGDEVRVLADASQLAQVFQNLLDNAIKFGGSGGAVAIGASLEELEAIVSVSDHGPGIAPEDLPRIFRRQVRGADADARAPGHGLGLAIAKQIVELHGGRIWAESGGAGATFRFTIPRADL